MLAPRSKSALTSRGVFARRCMRFRNAANAYGSALGVVRPLDQLTSTRPPTLVSRMSRRNLRYSRERVLGEVPENGMKISWATSSRSVIVFIHRRTADEVFAGGSAFAGLALRRTEPVPAAAATPTASSQIKTPGSVLTRTYLVCQISASARPHTPAAALGS